MAFGSAPSLIATHNAQGTITGAHLRAFKSKAGKPLTKTVITLDTGVEVELDGLGDKTAGYPAGAPFAAGVAKTFGRWSQAGGVVAGLPAADAAPAAPPAAPARASGGGASRGSFPIKGDDYQTSIIRQNALTNATSLVTAICHGVPSRKNPAGEYEDPTPGDVAKHAEQLSDIIIRVAYKYASFSSGNLDIRAAQEIANKAMTEAAE